MPSSFSSNGPEKTSPHTSDLPSNSANDSHLTESSFSPRTFSQQQSSSGLSLRSSPQTLNGLDSEVGLNRDDQDKQKSSQECVEYGVKLPPPTAPDGGYGWVVVACVFLINMHSWGLNSSYGVFLAHFVSNETYPNAGVLDYSFVAGISVAFAMLLAPLATYCVKRLGTRIALIIGSLSETLAMITASFTYQVWQLYLTQGLCFGIGLGFLFIASVGLIPQWFEKRRSFANAIGAAGSGLGGLVYNLACQSVISNYGYRWAYRMIGIVAFVVTFVCALLVRDRNKAIGAKVEMWNTKMLTKREYVMLSAWGWFSMFGYMVLIYTLPSYASSIGLTAQQGGVIGAIFNLGQACGRPMVGLTSDRVGRINIASVLTFVCGLLCLVWWIFAKTYGALVAFALVGGSVAGTYWATIAPVSAEIVGLRNLPVSLSMTWVIICVPIAVSTAIALEIRTHTNFVWAQLYTGLCYIAASLFLWSVRVWKVGQLEEVAAADNLPLGSVEPVQPPEPADAEIDAWRFERSSVFKRAIAWKRV